MAVGIDDAPGIALHEWTAEYRGLVIGTPESALTFTEIAGLLDAPPVRTSDRATLNRHGEVSGQDWLGARTVTLTIEVNGDSATEFDAAMSAVVTAFAPTRDLAPFTFRFPGVAGGGPRVVWGKVRKRSTVIDWAYTHRYATVLVELYCPNPMITDPSLSTGRTKVSNFGNGLRFPARFPLRFGASKPTEFIRVDNLGNFPTPFTFEVRGPIANPQIVNLTTGELIAISYVLLRDQWLVINTDTREVLLNGTTPQFLTPGRRTTWLTAPPGVNEIALRGARLPDPGFEPELIAQWRSAWV
ncbi:MAG: hypothetical protein ABIQ18_39810 [Umezawaea sp.]